MPQRASNGNRMADAAQKYDYEEIDAPMALIYVDEDFNVRGHITPTTCSELAKNIREMGLLQRVVIRGLDPKHPGYAQGQRYELVAGFRRHMAHLINRATHIKARLAVSMSDDNAHLINMIENLGREDLTITQEAAGLKALKERGYTIAALSDRLNVSAGWIKVRYMVLELEPEIQREIDAGFLTQEDIKLVHALPPGSDRYDAVKNLKEAKSKGIKPRTVKGVAAKPLKRRKRSESEIYWIQDHLTDQFGPIEDAPSAIRLSVRLLGWINGHVNDIELYADLRRFADDEDLPYEIPEEAMQALSL